MHKSDRTERVSRAALPSAAQRWLERVLPENHTFPSSVRLEQAGQMELRDRWTPFTAHGIYEASPLSFNWQARFPVFPGVWIIAEDGHRRGQGWGSARLWGIISMGGRTGPQVLASQLVRNLGELAWLPSLVLADPALTWADAGDSAFEVRGSAGDHVAMVRFEINDEGDIVRAHSPSRPYDVPGGFAEAPWSYEFHDHRQFAGVRIPASAVGTFDKADGPWEYFRGEITAVRFLLR